MKLLMSCVRHISYLVIASPTSMIIAHLYELVNYLFQKKFIISPTTEFVFAISLKKSG